jgi:hypothetical protein
MEISFKKLYYLIYLFFYRIYVSFFPIKPPINVPSILDITNDYIEVRTQKFLDSFEKNMDYNTNIEKEFYDKDKYKKIIMYSSNILETTWKKRILFETTPRGNIIMYYDAYKLGFAYYSDSYNLPYRLLNALAMKYVITFFCRDFFMDDGITPKDQSSPLIKIHIDEPEKSNDVKKNNMKKTLNKINTISKNYSMQTNKTSQKKSNQTNQHIEKSAEAITNQNRFIYLGKIMNFKFLQTKPRFNSTLNGFGSNLLDNLEGETKLQKKVMSYQEYKNLRNRKVKI